MCKLGNGVSATCRLPIKPSLGIGSGVSCTCGLAGNCTPTEEGATGSVAWSVMERGAFGATAGATSWAQTLPARTPQSANVGHNRTGQSQPFLPVREQESARIIVYLDID